MTILLYSYWLYFILVVNSQTNSILPGLGYENDFQTDTDPQTTYGYKIDKNDSNPIVTVVKGEDAELFCDIFGNPKPNITWKIDGINIKKSIKYDVIQENWGSVLVIKNVGTEDERTYECIGKNLGGTVKVSKTLIINENSVQPEFDGIIENLNPGSKDQCQKFSSQVCAGFLKNQIVHVSHKHDQSNKEKILFNILRVIQNQISEEPEECISEISQILCYYNFPICLENSFNGRFTSDKVASNFDAPIKKYSAFQLCRVYCTNFIMKCPTLFAKLKSSLTMQQKEYFINCKKLGLEPEGSCIEIKNNKAILPNMTEFIRKQKENADEEFEERDQTNSSKYWPILITFASLFAITGFLVLICVFCRCAFLQNFGRSTRFSSDFHALNSPRGNSLFRHSELKSSIFQNFKNFRGSTVMGNHNNNNSVIPIMPNQGLQNINSMPYPINHPTIINNSNSLTNENPGSFDSSFGESFSKNQNSFGHLMNPNSDMNKSPVIKPTNQNYYNNSTKSSNISQHHYQTVFGSKTLIQPLSPNNSDMEQKLEKNQKYIFQRGWSNYAQFNQLNISPNYLQSKNVSEDHTPTSIELNSDIVDYNYNSIKFDTNLGHGLFGPMYNGEFQLKNGTYENGNDTLNYSEVNRLFIKTLAPGSSGNLQVEFINEANVMNQLKHNNLLSLMGVSIHQLPWCMLFDISGYHELPDYFSNLSTNNSEMLTVQMILQLSSGLVYLSDKNFAHQDISARNVLINPYKSFNNEISFTVKLTNLAFGRNRYSSDYQAFVNKSLDINNNQNNQIFLPIRWMSPESLVSGKFTLESDIWSFGILIWELVTNCKLKPYFNINENLLADYIIENGNKLLLPSIPNVHNDFVKFTINCLYDCLNMSSVNRPKFAQIYEVTFNCLYNHNSSISSSGKNKKSLTESINSSLTHTTISSNSTVSSSKNFQS